MLTNCPECDLQVSDKALICPHCGYPLKSNQESRKQNKSKKYRRLPNGFGQISEIKNQSLRKPFRAMISVGKTEEGRPIVKPLKPEAYFKTYNEAYAALLEYNKKPYDLLNGMTLEMLYEKWIVEYEKGTSDKTIKNIRSAWAKCHNLYDLPVREIKTRHCKICIDQIESYNTQKLVKILLKKLFDYALQYELTDQNYAENIILSNEALVNTKAKTEEHIAFTKEELDILWKNINDEIASLIIIQCYMGWRPREFTQLKLTDVDLDNQIITGGMKTENGKDRKVPIIEKIKSLVNKAYIEAENVGSEYLLKGLSYDAYRSRFKACISDLNINPKHRPHDPRKTFITLCKAAHVDEYAIKYLVGHSIRDLTERVYTEREIEWLREEISKI